MDWPERKHNSQKQPPDKKVKPKYISKEEAEGQKLSKEEAHVAHEDKKESKILDKNNQKTNRKYQNRTDNLERPKFIEKNSSQ